MSHTEIVNYSFVLRAGSESSGREMVRVEYHAARTEKEDVSGGTGENTHIYMYVCIRYICG